MWEAIYHWILWRKFTLLSLYLRHVISRASTPLTSLLSRTFRDVSSRDVRIVCPRPKCCSHDADIRHEFSTGVNIKIAVLWDVALCVGGAASHPQAPRLYLSSRGITSQKTSVTWNIASQRRLREELMCCTDIHCYVGCKLGGSTTTAVRLWIFVTCTLKNM